MLSLLLHGLPMSHRVPFHFCHFNATNLLVHIEDILIYETSVIGCVLVEYVIKYLFRSFSDIAQERIYGFLLYLLRSVVYGLFGNSFV